MRQKKQTWQRPTQSVERPREVLGVHVPQSFVCSCWVLIGTIAREGKNGNLFVLVRELGRVLGIRYELSPLLPWITFHCKLATNQKGWRKLNERNSGEVVHVAIACWHVSAARRRLSSFDVVACFLACFVTWQGMGAIHNMQTSLFVPPHIGWL